MRMALESELALMRADRQGLAENLDRSSARGRLLEEQLLSLDQRIDRAMLAVRDALKDDRP